MSLVFYAVTALVGVILVIFGYLIKFKRKTNLINDYKIKDIKNEEGYTNWIGATELIIGLIMSFLSILGFVWDKLIFVGVADVILIITLIVLLIYGNKKYRR